MKSVQTVVMVPFLALSSSAWAQQPAPVKVSWIFNSNGFASLAETTSSQHGRIRGWIRR